MFDYSKKVYRSFQSNLHEYQTDLFPLIILSIMAGCAFFLVMVLPLQYIPRTEDSEWIIFILTWVLLPLVAVFTPVVFFYLKNHRFKIEDPFFYIIPVGINSITIYAVVWGLYKSVLSILGSVLIILAVNIFSVFFSQFLLQRLSPAAKAKISFIVYNLVPLLTAGTLYVFAGVNLTIGTLIILALVALVSEAHPIFSQQSGVRFNRFFNWVVVIIIASIVFVPSLPYNVHHFNYYLGPINDYLNGKTILVDSFSQYGTGVILFLSLIYKITFLPVSYYSFSFILMVLTFTQFVLEYLLLLRITKSSILSAIALAVILFISFYTPAGSYYLLPASGPLRFGLPILLMFVVVVRIENLKYARLLKWVELILVGFSAVWSIETFVYTTAMYFGILAHESLSETDGLKQATPKFFLKIFYMILAQVVTTLLLSGLILLRSGELPNWGVYLEYFGVYSVEKHLTSLIEQWSSWAIVIGIYFASLVSIFFVFVYNKKLFASTKVRLAFGLTMLGIAQFSYFLGRSSLLYLAVVSYPAVMLVFSWAKWMSSIALIPSAFRRSSIYVFYLAIILIFYAYFPVFYSRLSDTVLMAVPTTLLEAASGSPITLKKPYRLILYPGPSECRVAEAIQEIKKYAPQENRVLVFISPEMTTEVYMLSKRSNVFPLSNPDQDGILRSNLARVENFPYDINDGSLLVIEVDENTLMPIQQVAVDRLERSFNLRLLEKTECGLAAYRLDQK